MIGANQDVSELDEIERIEDEIGRIEALARLVEEFVKKNGESENEESKDLDVSLHGTSHAVNHDYSENVSSTQTTQGVIIYDKNQKMIMQEQGKVSPAPRSSTPSKIPTLPKIAFNNPSPLHTPLKHCKIPEISTTCTTTTKTTTTPAGSGREKNIAYPSRVQGSSTHATGSKIGRPKFSYEAWSKMKSTEEQWEYSVPENYES